MNIADVLFCAGSAGFFFDDQRAIKKGASSDGFTYEDEPVTPGFKTIRQAGECISIMIILDNGAIALGDAAAVQYSGAGGRDPLFLAEHYLPFLNEEIRPLLTGYDVGCFREADAMLAGVRKDGKKLHTALRYGLSQALLDAVAKASGRLRVEVICEEYDLPVICEPVPVFGQTGDHRYDSADRMILKHVDVLPHALINNVEDKLGRDGNKLVEYVEWLAARIRKLRLDEDYSPDIHIDVYGNLGTIFDNDVARMSEYLAGLNDVAGEFPLYIEGPVDMEEKAAQIDSLSMLRDSLQRSGIDVKIVADEWCNTLEDIRDFTDAACCDMIQVKTPDLGGMNNVVEAVLYCRKKKMESYQGGTCNETDMSARCCVHAALAARPDRMLAKPGMGFDEGYMIVRNEMERTLALLSRKK
ncbi:MAG: methylaspartate ammonia-lyase [Verrucomicrobiota bacterium]